MQTENYRGCTLWGHAILQQESNPRTKRFAGSGTFTHVTKVVNLSEVLGHFG